MVNGMDVNVLCESERVCADSDECKSEVSKGRSATHTLKFNTYNPFTHASYSMYQ